MPGPLEGVNIMELGVWVAGPAAGGILADWGADTSRGGVLAGGKANRPNLTFALLVAILQMIGLIAASPECRSSTGL